MVPGSDSGKELGMISANNQGNTLGYDSGSDLGKVPGSDSGKESGTISSKEVGQDKNMQDKETSFLQVRDLFVHRNIKFIQD
jgi:hypothetical protein